MADPWDDRAVSPLDDDGKERLKQILELLEAPSTLETQQKILEELKKNPSLMLTFIEHRRDKATEHFYSKTEQCLEKSRLEQSQQSSVENQEIETSRSKQLENFQDSATEKSVSEEQE